jgi:hypothetical protein
MSQTIKILTIITISTSFIFSCIVRNHSSEITGVGHAGASGDFYSLPDGSYGNGGISNFTA